MAIELKKEDFINRISNTTKKIIGIGALAFVLTGCNASLQTKSPIQAAAIQELPEISKENNKKMFDNSESGVYKHPIYKDRIMTYEFLNDESANEKIKKELKKIGLDDGSLEFVQLLSSLSIKSNDIVASHYIQNLFKSSEDDLNYVFINPENTEDYNIFINEKSLSYKMMTDEEKEYNDKMLDYARYDILMHETAHSLDGQKLKGINIIKFLTNDKLKVKGENSAEIFSTLAVSKEMFIADEDNLTLLKYLDDKKSKFNALMNSNKKDNHNAYTSVLVTSALIETNKEYVKSLSMEEMGEIATALSEISVDYNFSNEYNEELKYDINLTLESFLENDILNDLNKLPKFVDEIEKLLDLFKDLDEENGDINNKKKEIYSMEILLNVSQKINEIIKDNNYMDANLSEEQKNIIKEDIYKKFKKDDLSLSNYNHEISRIDNFSELSKKLIERLEKDNIRLPENIDEFIELSDMRQYTDIALENKVVSKKNKNNLSI